MNDAVLSILVTAEDNASPQIRNLGQSVTETHAQMLSWAEFLKGRMGPAMQEFGGHAGAMKALSQQFKEYKEGFVEGEVVKEGFVSKVAIKDSKDFQATLIASKEAVRELGMGLGFLGASFLSMGVMLKSSQNTMGQSVGNILVMVGGMMSAVSASVQFISAIAKMASALKVLNLQLIITQALSGPAGWAILGVGAMVAIGATAGITAISRSQPKAPLGAEIGTTRGLGTTAVMPQREQTGEQHITIENKINLDGRQIGESVRQQIFLAQQRNNTSGIK